MKVDVEEIPETILIQKEVENLVRLQKHELAPRIQIMDTK